jgi:hypothetical protein
VGVEALPGQAQAGQAGSLADGRHVTADRADALADASRWRGTDLDLAAGLDGEPALAGQRPRARQERQRLGQALLIHRKSGVVPATDQPFQFDPDPARRAGLEGDAVHLRFGIILRQRGVIIAAADRRGPVTGKAGGGHASTAAGRGRHRSPRPCPSGAGRPGTPEDLPPPTSRAVIPWFSRRDAHAGRFTPEDASCSQFLSTALR